MTARRDYSCEVIGLIVLTVLSALSHFWYIMIAIGVLAAFCAAGFLLFRIFSFAKRGMLPNAVSKDDMPVRMGRGTSPSLPA